MKNLLRNFGFLMLLTVIVFFAAGCPEEVLPAPTGLTAESSADGKVIILKWDPVENATGYEIFGSFKSSGPFVFIGEVRSGTGFHVSSMDEQGNIPLKPDTTYYFKVACHNGELSSSKSVKTKNPNTTPTIPETPTTPTTPGGEGGS